MNWYAFSLFILRSCQVFFQIGKHLNSLNDKNFITLKENKTSIFFSNRYIVLFSIERFIVVKFPHRKDLILTGKRSFISIIGLLLFSLVFYSYTIITTRLEKDVSDKSTSCVTYDKWFVLVSNMSIVDIILTVPVPILVVVIINMMIIVYMRKHFSSKKNVLQRSAKRKRAKRVSRTTSTLLLISTIYILLNSLMVYTKIKNYFQSEPDTLDQPHSNKTTIEWFNSTYARSEQTHQFVRARTYTISMLIERIAFYLYYLNYSINFFLYVLNGSELRKILKSFFFRR